MALTVGQTLFRFHTGSIKSLVEIGYYANLSKFRFHTGSIKSARGDRGIRRRTGFDSILVRLKAYDIRPLRGRCDSVSIPYWFD